MKPPPQPKPARNMPKARVMFESIYGGIWDHASESVPVAVIPCIPADNSKRAMQQAQREARQIVRLHGMARSTLKVELCNVIFRTAYFPQHDYQHRIAEAVMQHLNIASK